MPAIAKALGKASEGAVVKSTGACSASAKPTIFASGARPRSLALPVCVYVSAALHVCMQECVYVCMFVCMYVNVYKSIHIVI